MRTMFYSPFRVTVMRLLTLMTLTVGLDLDSIRPQLGRMTTSLRLFGRRTLHFLTAVYSDGHDRSSDDLSLRPSR